MERPERRAPSDLIAISLGVGRSAVDGNPVSSADRVVLEVGLETKEPKGGCRPDLIEARWSGNGEVWQRGEITEAGSVTAGVLGVAVQSARGDETCPAGRRGGDAGPGEETATTDVTGKSRSEHRHARKTLGDVGCSENGENDSATRPGVVTACTRRRAEDNNVNRIAGNVDENRNLSSEPNGESKADLTGLRVTGVHTADAPTDPRALTVDGSHHAPAGHARLSRATEAHKADAVTATRASAVDHSSDLASSAGHAGPSGKAGLREKVDVRGILDLSKHAGLARRNTVGVSRGVDGKSGKRSVNGCLWTQNGTRKGKLRKSVSFNIPRPRSPER